jgi:hypothetical protein
MGAISPTPMPQIRHVFLLLRAAGRFVHNKQCFPLLAILKPVADARLGDDKGGGFGAEFTA